MRIRPRRQSLKSWLLLLVFCFATVPVRTQTRCQPPAPPTNATEPNIFNAQQESDLGDAISEQLQRNFKVIDDDAVASYLQQVGERLLKQLPLTNLHFQFLLYDQPEANAFALAGGHIYVSRKLVGFVKTEDEFAGVLAHEIGHVVTHQTAIDLTRIFKEVLGVTQVTDRRDVFDKYHQLVDNAARKPKAFRHGEDEKEQLTADQVAILTMAAAGYDPHAYSTFWDRFAEAKGKTGGWFSDLFGTTKPEARRLREMLKTISSLPAECQAVKSTGSAEEFQKWQVSVINYTGLGRKENLHAVVSKKSLDPPLRGDVTYLRFSPDGKYLLAQDDSGVNVLSRDPFAPLFRINAPEARPAQFTPDSQSIVVYNQGLRVELWSVADAQLKEAHELVISKGCLQTVLAPDGKMLACFDPDFNLTLFDVASGSQIFQKKSFYTPSLFEYLLVAIQAALNDEDIEILKMAFSPDGHYFVAGQRDAAIAFDVTTNTSLSLPGSIRKLISLPFSFVGPDKLIGTDSGNVRKSALVSFPSGKVLSELSIGPSHLEPASHGHYLFIRPIKNFPVGVVDLSTLKIFMASKQSAIDIYDDVSVSERKNGELGLYEWATGKTLARVFLTRNPLGRLRAIALSPNMRWLAVSERTRGAVWDLTTGGEQLFRGFRGAYLSDDGFFYADFPKEELVNRSIVKTDVNMKQVVTTKTVEEAHATQFGRYLLVTKANNKDTSLRENVTVELRDIPSGQWLWSKSFPKEAPGMWTNAADGTLVFFWAVSSSTAKAEIKSDAGITHRLSSLREKEGVYFLEVLEAQSGDVKGKLLIETGKGSFRIGSVFATGDWLVITDTQNRVLIYSLSTGEQKAHMFGSRGAVARNRGLLAVENEAGKVALYDLATLTKLDEFVFSSPVLLARFGPDEKRLFILTANQTIYFLDVSDLQKTTTPAP